MPMKIVPIIVGLMVPFLCFAAEKGDLAVVLAGDGVTPSVTLLLTDRNADGCWDIATMKLPSGATQTMAVVDGACSETFRVTDVRTQVTQGNIEGDEWHLLLVSKADNTPVGTLYKDSQTPYVLFIPSVLRVGTSNSTQEIGVQISVLGDKAIVASDNRTHASIQIVQTDGGQPIDIFDGFLDSGTTSVSIPPSVQSGTHIFSVVTTKGRSSVPFVVQR